MGCCLSKNPPSKSILPYHPDKKLPKPQNYGESPPPSPPPVEEEAVKEVVLSETPIPKPSTPVVEKVKPPAENQEFKVKVQTTEINKSKETTVLIKPPAEDIVISEVSEQSELCSLTESFSTTATPKEKDYGEEVNQISPVKYRRKKPNTGDFAGVTERNVRSPARRAVPSPEKRIQVKSSRPVQARAMTAAQRRNIGPSSVTRRDFGEGPARRSRSPVTRGGEVGPRRNMRYKSPGMGGRSPARAVENGGRGKVVEKQNDILIPGSREIEKQNDNGSPENEESLENPLVSLECFIFL